MQKVKKISNSFSGGQALMQKRIPLKQRDFIAAAKIIGFKKAEPVYHLSPVVRRARKWG
jgi:hypothetical protein